MKDSGWRRFWLFLAILIGVGGLILKILIDQWRVTGFIRDILNPVSLASAYSLCVYLSKKYDARMSLNSAAASLLTEDPRPPVLYLRSFTVDAKEDTPLYLQAETQEEKLKSAFDRIGPFIALGRPGESFPTLGARRTYVRGEWEKKVTDLILRSRLVVLRIGATDSLLWEVQYTTQRLRPEQLLLIVPRGKKNYELFRSKAQLFFPCRLPEYPSWVMSRSRIKGLVCFEPDWTPRFLTFRHMLLRGSFTDALPRAMQAALRPVYEHLGIPWRPPALNWSRVLSLGLCALILLYALYMNVT